MVVSRLLHGIYEAPKKGIYKPTMVVGLGGTGIRSLRVLKKELQKGKVLQQESFGVKLLGIDSDMNEMDKYPQLPVLAQSELCLMNADVGMSVLSLSNSDPAYQFVQEYLPSEQPGLLAEVRGKVAAGHGAGQFRRAGKLLFAANVTDGAGIKRRLQDLQLDLVGLASLMKKQAKEIRIDSGVDIYVVCSFAGGTGAGILLDFIALTRTLFNGVNDKITVVGLLPGYPLDNELQHPQIEKPVTRGNAYGVLQELKSLMDGKVKYTFRFDPENKLKWDGSHPFVDAAYLVGDELFGTGKRVPVASWKEIWEAAAYFLYALVGTGVGSTEASGAVNSHLDGYSALGVGVAKYPIEDMASYSVRMAIENGCSYWLDTKADQKKVKAELNATLADCGMSSLGGLRGLLPQLHGDIAKFWKRVSDVKQALKLKDGQFIKRCKDKRDTVDADLVKHDELFSAKREEFLANLRAVLDKRARTLITGPHQIAIGHFEELGRHLDTLGEQLAQYQRNREKEEKRLSNRLSKLKDKIDFWDFGTDRSLRREHIKKTNDYLTVRCDAHLDRHVNSLIIEITSIAASYLAEARTLRATLNGARQSNLEQMSRWRSANPSFMLSVYADKRLREWCEGKGFGEMVSTGMTLSSLSIDALLLESLSDAEEGVLRELAQLDLIKDARKDKSLKAGIATLNLSSNPLMPMTEVLHSQLAPQKFVAGKDVDDAGVAQFAQKTFPPPGSANIQLSALSNPHAVLCVQTIHGVDITKWLGFGLCEDAFTNREATWGGQEGWRYRTLPDACGIDSLRREDEAKGHAYGVLGLGLMIDAIAVAGSNYYQNLEKSQISGMYTYLAYSVDRRESGRLLIEKALVNEAPKGHTRKLQDRRIASSLSDCVEGVTKSVWTDLAAGIEDTVDQLKSTVGSEKVQSLILEFCQSFVDAKLKRADVNFSHWKKMRDSLERFSRDLG